MDLKSLIKFIKDELLIPCATGVLIAIAVNLVVGFTIVNGSSMSPTLEDKDYLLLTKINRTNPEKGDIIVFDTTPFASSKEKIFYIKRVIATEGDHITIDNGVVKVNGVELKENYTDGSITEGDVDIVIPSGKCFVLGDNRDGSSDSRIFGAISVDDIQGIVVNRLYPFKLIESKQK